MDQEREQAIVEILTQSRFTGRLWEKHGKRRIYFNTETITEHGGLDYGKYRTGNISSASINHEHISNSECRRILAYMENTKIFYDLDSGEFCVRSRHHECNTNAERMIDDFIADMREALGETVDG